MGWHLRVEAHLAVAYEGELRVDDPDGIVVDARPS
jgi:8-oxo-dGTP diphosphatase